MHIVTVLTILFAISSAAAADMLKPQLRTALFGRSPIIDDSQPSYKHSTVFFTEEPVRFQVKVAWRDSSLVPDSSLAEWWRDVDVHLASGGVLRTIAAEDIRVVEVRTKGRRVAGAAQGLNIRPLPDATFAIFELGPLPAGNYELRANMRFVAGREYKVTAPELTFAVLRGDEDDYARRLLLRKRADAAKSFEEFKAVQLQLLNFEPRNTALFEALADRSLNNAPAAETRAWYRRAYETRLGNAEEFKARRKGRLTKEEQHHIAADLSRLSVFDRVYETYVTRRKDGVRLIPFQFGGEKTYAWEDRSGRTLAVIDVRNPHRTHSLQR